MRGKYFDHHFFLSLYLFASVGCLSVSTKTSGDHVIIGEITWASYNLSTNKYRNGDSILQVQDPAEWATLTYGAWCYYENSDSFGELTGKLYNWYAVNDERGLCPDGWHISTNDEWEKVVELYGGEEIAASKLKSEKLWELPRVESDNSSLFSTLPGGNRREDGLFNGFGLSGVFWTSTEVDNDHALARYMNRAHSMVGKRAGDKRNGLSCRCVKD